MVTALALQQRLTFQLAASLSTHTATFSEPLPAVSRLIISVVSTYEHWQGHLCQLALSKCIIQQSMPSTLHTLSLITSPAVQVLRAHVEIQVQQLNPTLVSSRGKHTQLLWKRERQQHQVSIVSLVEVVHSAACMTVSAVSAALLLTLLLHDWKLH